MWGQNHKLRWRITWKAVLVGALTLLCSTLLMMWKPESDWMFRLSGCLMLLGFSSVSLPRAVKEVRPHLYRGWLKKYGEWLEPNTNTTKNRSADM
ncbi:hypothetical protein JSY36_04280 [Bacillus sp. H-16]|uniref:hypothetical protein n=1 Tax=Alteribacter salitolerans TaxID=2912333 RepID=UPI0019634CC6|nr:hypothetical protein [Alteribacter salitolerans]MBM7094968.1 hypothetical protein [Alteribacter salitolerans]